MARAEYNGHHPRLRRALLAAYLPGVTPCFLCRRPMADPGRLLDLAHKFKRGDPRRAGGPRGLAHRRCNRGHKYDPPKPNTGSDPAPTPRTRW
jgi:hypothetical protein